MYYKDPAIAEIMRDAGCRAAFESGFRNGLSRAFRTIGGTLDDLIELGPDARADRLADARGLEIRDPGHVSEELVDARLWVEAKVMAEAIAAAGRGELPTLKARWAAEAAGGA